MTKRLYPKGAELTLTKQIDWVGDTLKAHLMDDAYVPNFSTNDYRDDIAAHIVSTVTLASKSATGGVFDAADLVFPSVTAGRTCNAVVFTQEGGTDATSPLLIYVDQGEITNFPVTTSGGNVSVTLPNTAYKVFSLVP
jgi:hypothetical protein